MSLSKKVVKFNSHTTARDKIFRFVQYGSKLILWQMTYGSPEVQSEVITRLKKLEAAIGLSRKLFRMGNFMDLAHKSLDAFSIPEKGLMLLAVTSTSTKALWLLIDHFMWFCKVGLVKGDVSYWTKLSLKAWLIAQVTATISNVIKYEAVMCKVEGHKKNHSSDVPFPKELQVTMHSVRMNLWRDACDMFIPLGGLQIVSPGFAALAGVISSAIGFQLEWERHIAPFQPKSS